MARPPKPVAAVCYKPSLRLYPGEDDDLIAYLEASQANGLSLSQAVIIAMRNGSICIQVATVDDSMERVRALADNLFFD